METIWVSSASASPSCFSAALRSTTAWIESGPGMAIFPLPRRSASEP